MDFAKLTEKLWRIFFSEMPGIDMEIKDKIIEEKILKWVSDDCIIIGTGAHEFHVGLDGFLCSFAAEIVERNDTEFHFENLWSEQMKLGSESCLVYGKFYVSGESKDKSVLINMDSRFTILFHKIDEDWKIVHIHLSIPSREQNDGEYYPKTLMKKVQELQSINEEMTELALKDSLTELDNFRAFKNKWEKRSECGWFFVLDLDCFKQVNDTYGHLAGNNVLAEMGKVFGYVVRENDLLCRMGGDEFLIFCSKMKDKANADEFAQRLINSVRKAGESKPYWTTVSIGATEVTPGMSVETALENADRFLYEVKKTGRGGFLSA